MNRFHQNHPDPEIREKYASWQKSYGDYQARSQGFNSRDEMDSAKKERKAAARNLQDLLGSISKGSNIQRRSTKQTVAKRMHRSAQRGA